MWGQVGPLAGDIRLMFGKFGACWGYLGFYGGLGEERKKPPTKEDVVDGFLRCNLKACVRPKWGQVGALVRSMLGLYGVLWRSWGGKKKPPTKEDVLCRSWRGEKKTSNQRKCC